MKMENTHRSYFPLLAGLSLLVAALYVHVMLKTAWVCDDAFITFRSVENFFAGVGLTWNPHERVQTYTHPAWMFFLLVARTVTVDLYRASVLLNFFLVGTLLLLLVSTLVGRRGKEEGLLLVLASLFLFLSSKAFIDFSTSGLENTLSYLLLFSVFLAALDEESESRLWKIFLLCGFLPLVRHDLVLFVLPLVLREFLFGAGRFWIRCQMAFLGAVPLLSWSIFSLIYYGFPFPNTAYAKLNIAQEKAVLLEQGAHYFLNSLTKDPVTIPIVVLAIVLSLFSKKIHFRMFALGLILSLFYTFWIGGDFMSGRFFSVPYLMATLLLVFGVRIPWLLLIAVVALGVSLTKEHSPLRSAEDYGGYLFDHGIADERGFYAEMTHFRFKDRDTVQKIQAYRDGVLFSKSDKTVILRDTFGFFAYGAGPKKIIHDSFALSSPYVARMPIQQKGFRPGHVYRVVSPRFLRSEARGENLLKRARYKELYDTLSVMTRGPVWSLERFKVILLFHLGMLPDLKA